MVYHLAAVSRVMASVRNPALCFRTNAMGTQAVAEACRKSGAGLVFTSSREVYGDAGKLPVREDAPMNPKNPYGASKLMGETVISSYGRTYGLRYCILRLSNIYGEGDSERVLPVFVEKYLKGEELRVYGGKQVLDMLHVSDAVEALIRAKPCKLTVNIGSGKGISVRELAEMAREATHSSSRISVEEAREEEVGAFVADISLAGEALGWKPRVGFEEGLRRLVEYMKKGNA
jgi:UDP-glucose 4-epimerase